jgi:hypothetical protein
MSEHSDRRDGNDRDIHIDFHFDGLADVLRPIIADLGAHVLLKLQELKQEIDTMSGALSQEIADLRADVQANKDVTASAVTLINGFAQRLADAIAAAQAAGATDAQLQDLAALHGDLSSNTQSLADAVTANTPATPTP